MTSKPQPRVEGVEGFTLFEALVTVALMGIVLFTLSTITAQWLPNWKGGFDRMQRANRLGVGIERILADLSAAQSVTANRDVAYPVFEGNERSVILVRSALGPNTGPGLEIVRFAETEDNNGFALVRERAAFVPLAGSANGVIFPEFEAPVVLVRAPFRVRFAYAGQDRVWHDNWHQAADLPSAVRVMVQTAGGQQMSSVSTIAPLRVTLPPQCFRASSYARCVEDRQPKAPAAPSAQVPL